MRSLVFAFGQFTEALVAYRFGLVGFVLRLLACRMSAGAPFLQTCLGITTLAFRVMLEDA